MNSRTRLLALVGVAAALWVGRSQWVAEADLPVRTRVAPVSVGSKAMDFDPMEQVCSTPGELPARGTFMGKVISDPFGASTPPAPVRVPVVAVPPPVVLAVVPSAPPPPVAPAPPALPYRFLGAVREPGVPPRVFLARGEALITAQAGDTLDGGFRLESVSARELVFMHLQQQRTVRLAVEGEPQ